MRRPLVAALAAAATLCLSTVALATSADAAPSASGLSHRNAHVCAAPAPGSAACLAIRHDTVDAQGTVTPAGRVTPNAVPAGHGATGLRTAYGLTGASSGGRTVAIVDAYDAPTAAADLATYRSAYGLPACTAASGCFTKVSQTGSTTALPRANGGWAQEISLDLDMVSAACPDCRILLVEARSASFTDLAAAVKYAASRKPIAISNSYGGSDSNTASITSAYNQPGIAVTASTGDSGYGAQSPATFPGVVAVGGTSLTRDSSARGYTEAAWSGAGSGCSTLNAKPTYQTADTQCTKKADADVSAVADPNTGVAVYDSYAYQGAKGWMVFGGTSASSPFIAGVYAQGTAFGSTAGAAGSYLWSHAAGNLNDVTTGSNGSCPTTVWCTAGTGWDGPTGLGTPQGTAAF
jgi:subtilase family serine protease